MDKAKDSSAGTAVATGLRGVVAAASSIGDVNGEKGELIYQGIDIHELATKSTFEEVIFLLWNGRLPKPAELDELKKALAANRGIPAEVTAFLKAAGKAAPMDVLRTAVSMLSLYDPLARDMSPEANKTKAIKLMSQ